MIFHLIRLVIIFGTCVTLYGMTIGLLGFFDGSMVWARTGLKTFGVGFGVTAAGFIALWVYEQKVARR